MKKRSASLLSFKAFITHIIYSIVVILSLGLLIFFTDDIQKFYTNKHHQATQPSAMIQAITLGNSHAGGLYFDALALKGLHFYNANEDLKDTLLKVNHLVPTLPKLRVIIIPTYMGLLYHSRATSLLHDSREFLLNIPLTFAVWQRYPLDSLIARVETGLSLRETLTQNLIQSRPANSCKIPRRTGPDKDGLIHGYHKHQSTISCLKAIAPQRITRNRIAPFQKSVQLNPDIRKHNKERLQKIIQRINTINPDIQLTLIRFPTAPPFQQLMPTYPDETKFLLQFAKKHKNVHFFDFTTHFNDTFNDNNIFFLDPDHLNVRGAEQFSKHLATLSPFAQIKNRKPLE
ncbi:hypothetical protein ACQZV8_02425 [Magnetococcales bacterium HHB-1]